MIKVITSVVLGCLPGIPSAGKWTRLGRPLDTFLCATTIHGCLGHLFALAYETLQYEEAEGNDPEGPEADHWHQVAGTRLKRSKELVASFDHLFAGMLMAVVLEPIRMLTRVFMKHAVGFRRHRRRKEWDEFIPDTCNFGTPEYSLLVACQQHMSTRLHTAEGRVRLLWGLGGEESFTVFAQQHRDLAWLIRQALLATSAWIYLRHQRLLENYPWELSGIIDPRLSTHAQEAIEQQWQATAPCCMPAGFAREWRARNVGPRLASHQFRRILRSWGFLVTSSIADVESKHAGNRARAHTQMSWQHFIGLYVNAEARCLKRCRAGPRNKSVPKAAAVAKLPLQDRPC